MQTNRPLEPAEAERRQAGAANAVSAEELIARHVASARAQLAEGRERLKSARRRVVQLEDALENWERLARELRGMRNRGAA